MRTFYLRFRWFFGALLAALVGAVLLAGTVKLDSGLAAAWTAGIILGLFLLLRLAQVLLRPGASVFGMARVVLLEAVHGRWVFWIAFFLIAVLAGLAFSANTNERLDYAERFFLEWSQLAVEITLGVFTLVLAAYSVSSEYAGKQIHTNLSKPVNRFTYIAGKWLGLMSINLVLAAVAGAAIYAYTGTIESRWVNASTLPADAQAVDRQTAYREVLTARFSTTPAMERPEVLSGYFLERVKILAQSEGLDNAQALAQKIKEADAAASPPDPESFKPLLSARDYKNCLELATGKWYTLGLPEEQAAALEPSQVYVFSGLFAARERGQAVKAQVVGQLAGMGLTEKEAEAFIPVLLGQTNVCPKRVIEWATKVYADKEQKAQLDAMRTALQADRLQLTLKPDAGGQTPREGMAELRVEVNGVPLLPLNGPSVKALQANHVRDGDIVRGSRLLPIGQPTSLEIPVNRIDAQGRLSVRLTRVLVNGQRPQPTISFDTSPTAGGIKLYGYAGPFPLNLAAALGVMLVKLGFLAMLGLVCGCLLSFPVACLVAIGIYAMAACTGGLKESFDDFVTLGRKPTEGLDFYFMWFKTIIRVGMQWILKVSPDFESYNARTQIVDGVRVSWRMMGECAGLLGLVWTGGVALAGWFLFERREIARVIV